MQIILLLANNLSRAQEKSSARPMLHSTFKGASVTKHDKRHVGIKKAQHTARMKSHVQYYIDPCVDNVYQSTLMTSTMPSHQERQEGFLPAGGHNSPKGAQKEQYLLLSRSALSKPFCKFYARALRQFSQIALSL